MGNRTRQTAHMAFDFRPALKASIKEAGIPRGWTVSEARGRVRLRVRFGTDGRDAAWTKTLPIDWEIGCIGPVTETLKALHQATSGDEAKSLSEAWLELHPEEAAEEPPPGQPTLTGGINWKAIAEAHYRDREANGTEIGDKTMAMEQRYCSKAVELMRGPKAPTSPYTLIDGCIDAGGWRDKPRARQQCVDAVVRMLSFGIAEGGLSESWQISQASKLKLKGSGKSKNARPVMELTDAQILELIDACPTAEWQNCLLVMATYGLRPIEVTELTVRRNPDTNKKQLFCTYRKACGGRSQKMETEPRFLWPMPLLDEDGEERNGDLTAAFEAGLLPLPPLKEKGEAVSQYLRRLKLWRDWQAAAAANGMDLRPYSFRNSYSVRCHARGIPSAMVAEAMGHSYKTHNEHYLTTTGRATAEVFERILNS